MCILQVHLQNFQKLSSLSETQVMQIESYFKASFDERESNTERSKFRYLFSKLLKDTRKVSLVSEYHLTMSS